MEQSNFYIMLEGTVSNLWSSLLRKLTPIQPEVVYYVSHIAGYTSPKNAETKKSFVLHSLEIRNISPVAAKNVKILQLSLPPECRTMKIRALDSMHVYHEKKLQDDRSEIIFPILISNAVVEILYLYSYPLPYPYRQEDMNASLPLRVTYKGGRGRLIQHLYNLSPLK